MKCTSVLLIAAGVAAAPSAAQEPAEHFSFYVVRAYDASRDPFADLEAAVQRASDEGKRILMEVGGTWCIDCLRLDHFISQKPSVAEKLTQSFLILKVNFSPENRNEEFLAAYPRIEWFPHINVLGSDGSLLHSHDTRQLYEERSLSEKRILSFLTKWAPNGERQEHSVQRAGSENPP